MSNFFHDLQSRGLISQKTPGIDKTLEQQTKIYWGIDPTANSLHLGHFLGVTLLKRALRHGHEVIVVAGGATGMIGDPGGKDEERPLLPKEEIEKNKEAIKEQLKKLFEVDELKIAMVDNSDWLEKLTLVQFLREAGKFIPVNTMLDKESVKERLKREQGISYAEFSYQLLQAYDFLMLFEKYNCMVQVGGSDQWGNIVQGVELIRKKTGKQAFGLSFPLITNPKTGKKFGKTEKGAAIWLDPEKTHPFAFYQFLVNTDDELAPNLMKYFSFKSMDEIKEIEKKWHEQKEKRLLQRELAFELTRMVHGEDVANHCKIVAKLLFEQAAESISKDNVEFFKKALPYTTVKNKESFNLEKVLVEIGLVSSGNDAHRLVTQNGVKSDLLFDKYYLIRKGKRDYAVVEIQ